jgi:hypothetical protein
VAVVCCLRVGLATVRADLDCLQRLACVSITGSVDTALMAALEILLGLCPLHVVAKVEPGSWLTRSVCKYKGV